MNTRLSRCLFTLSGLLMGVGLSCFAPLIPLPWLFPAFPFPESRTLSVLSGSACLFIGILCLLIHWLHHWQCTPRLARVGEAQVETHTPIFLDAQGGQTVPDVSQPEESERFPSWLVRTLQMHQEAGRAAVTRHILEEWQSGTPPLAATASGDDIPMFSCGVCGGPDPAALLFLCAHCYQPTHAKCCEFVRWAYTDGTTLSLDPCSRPHCHVCLEMIQIQGDTLVRDGLGLLLIRQGDFPNKC